MIRRPQGSVEPSLHCSGFHIEPIGITVGCRAQKEPGHGRSSIELPSFFFHEHQDLPRPSPGLQPPMIGVLNHTETS